MESSMAQAGQDAATDLVVDGMTCQNCARKVREAAQGVPGVAVVSADPEAGRAVIRWEPGSTRSVEAVMQAIRKAGYGVRLANMEGANNEVRPQRRSWFSGWGFNVVFGGFVTLVLLAGEWLGHWGMTRWFLWTAFALALPVQVFCGARFYVGAWRQLRAGSANMDLLVALGSSTAFGFSTWGLLTHYPGHLYFMEGAAIITLISVGHWLEARASTKAASALQALLTLAPPKARVQRNLQEIEVSVAEIRKGDSVVLRPGDRVPVDGTVSFGESSLDEAMLTGESLPVDKKRGDKLYAGTINQAGRLVMRVTATGEATALAHIIAAVERAQHSRAAIQRLGDRVSSIFVPAVVVVAVLVALWWGFSYDSARSASAWAGQFLWPSLVPATALAAAIIQAVAVLIVACPCAMGLATPTAIMAAANVAARRGILIRDGQALEKTGQITAVLFDKTGTLTTGQVTRVASKDLRLETERHIPFDLLAAALAQPSAHPLSQAIARMSATPVQDLPVLSGWRELRGHGNEARGSLQSDTPPVVLRLGALRWLAEQGINLATADDFLQEWSTRGATVVGLSADQQLLGVIALQDAVKPGAAEVVRRLKDQGKKVFLVTGDSQRTAAAIAAAAGIDGGNVFAEVRPERKADIVKQLQQQGERVAFVGDGINDAPALEQADLGIAVSRASDVAREAADIILLQSDLAAVPESLALAQQALRTIKQNLFWAFFYNATAIPLAALGFLSPVLCAATMGLSDLIVIGNSLRLYRWRP